MSDKQLEWETRMDQWNSLANHQLILRTFPYARGYITNDFARLVKTREKKST